jgi:hypothetical protein
VYFSSRKLPTQVNTLMTVRLVGGEEDETASIDCAHRDKACHVAFSYRGKVIEESARDFFEAFCHVRLRLEYEKLIPMCYGASLNVYPSGMGRDMSAGLMAYRTTVGKVPESADLVNIFDYGPDFIPATVAQQRGHWQEWLKSRGFS